MIRLPYLPWKDGVAPIIEVELKHGETSVRTLAYVDTGATYSVFQADFCEELGLSIREGRRKDITVGDGGIIPIYLHELVIRIEDLEFEGIIGFSERLGLGINILGRTNVLDEYLICFDGRQQEIVWHD